MIIHLVMCGNVVLDSFNFDKFDSSECTNQIVASPISLPIGLCADANW